MIPLAKYREAGKHKNVEAFTVQDESEVDRVKRHYWADETDGNKELEFWRW